MKTMKYLVIAFAAMASGAVFAANPILPLWEYIPDGEPYVFEDPDHPGMMRVYLYGSHDTLITSYCGRDYTLWSAPLGDVNRWRCEGVIFRSINDANGQPMSKSGDVLWDPDAQVVTGKDGKKTYYLFPFTVRAPERLGMAAKSSRPNGPFEVCNWSTSDPRRVVGLGVQLATFVDDVKRVRNEEGCDERICDVLPCRLDGGDDGLPGGGRYAGCGFPGRVGGSARVALRGFHNRWC